MSVIALPNIAPRGPGAGIEWELRSNTARFPSPLTGYTRTLERFGSHWAAKLRYENLNTADAARMRTFLSACRGQAQRFQLRDYGYTQRGSFPATELWPNTAFASTTGLTPSADTQLTAADGILRATRLGVASNQFAPRATSAVTVVQYAPYIARFVAHQGRGAYAAGLTAFDNDSGTRLGSTVTTFGRVDGVLVPIGTTAIPGLLDEATSGLVAGDYLELSFASFARGALVDNGPNFTQQSDTLDNAYWTKNAASVSANAAASPDGTTTADTIVENGAAAAHYITRTETRTSAVADWCAFGYFKRASGTRNIRLVVGRDNSNYVHAIFDLGGGTIAQAAAAVGDAASARAYIASAGNGWYYCALVGRLTATTGLIVYSELANGTTLGYAGDGASGVRGWRVGCAQSSHPTRGMQTTTAGDADGTSQTGSGLYLKGLPVSTSGLLAVDDRAEILTPSGSEYVRARAPVNTDAAGMGYFQFEPPLRESPVDSAAVILQSPMFPAMLDDRSVSWSQGHAGFTNLEFTAVEDITV